MVSPAGNPVIKILVVDDSADLAAMWRITVDAEPDMQCVGLLESADHLASSVEALRPDVVLLDLTMPGKNPLDALREVTQRGGRTRVLVNSGHTDAVITDAAIDAGAVDVICKSEEISTILAAIRRVATI